MACGAPLYQGDAELADGPGTASAARQLLRGSGLARPLLEALHSSYGFLRLWIEMIWRYYGLR